MDQRTHAWIAIRAIRLLEIEDQVPRLVELLKPYTREAAIGAWIPDKRDAKLGGAQTQNHVFKIGPYDGSNKSRFVLSKRKTTNRLGTARLLTQFLSDHTDILNAAWWREAYKADPPPGRHLANRAMALGINNTDMLILGDPGVQALVPGAIRFIENVAMTTRCSAGQVALFFFMLSHFIADSMMPCHCDERDLSDYATGLHKEMEKHWSRKIGTYFSEEKLNREELNDDDILDEAELVDAKFGIEFANLVPAMECDDIWEEVVVLCRGSFAMASVIAPPNEFPYKPGNQKMAPFETLFETTSEGSDLLEEVDRVCMHDSVLNVAITWKHIWKRFN